MIVITMAGNTGSIVSQSVSNFFPASFNSVSNGLAGTNARITFSFLSNPANTNGGNITVNGVNAAFSFLTTLGATPGSVLIEATTRLTSLNFLDLLQNPTVTNAKHVAFNAVGVPSPQTIISWFNSTSADVAQFLAQAVFL